MNHANKWTIMSLKFLILSLFIVFIADSLCFAEGLEKERNNLLSKKNNYTEINHFSKFNINNISTFIYNNGDDGSNPNGNSGFEYPKGSNTHLIYHSGLLWGAKKNGKIHVGGSSFSHGLLGGKILESGTPQDPNDPSARVFRVRQDFKSADLFSEIADEKLSEIEVRSQYEKDWNEWPAIFGAPYDDVDKNGIYNPAIDIPGVPGADQTLWYAANDLDSNQAKELYGSPTLGVELQVTIWGYKTYPQNNIMYKKYKLINKSGADFTDMFISQWADADVLSASDDFVGCDTLLNLGYTYNGNDYDHGFFINSIIPAVGFQLMQGPIVEGNPNDVATINNHKIFGYKNLPLTSFLRLLKNYNTNFDDPYLGDYNKGTLVVYNFMQGLDWKGNKTIDPITGKESTFMVTGNPVSSEGWVENSNEYSPGDRRLIMSSGPFNMAVGDTQEVIYAEIAGVGDSRLISVEILKNYADMNINSKIKLALPDFEQPNFKFAKWGATEEIELILSNKDEVYNFDKNGYKFQGLNLYLFDVDNEFNAQTIKQTFDIVDGIKQVTGQIEEDNKIYQSIIQTGNDSGIPISININKDLFANTPLIPGKEYSFGLSAYYTNPNEKASVFESFINSKSIEYLSRITNPQYGDSIYSEFDNSQYSLDVKVSNPSLLTGSEYLIRLNQTESDLSFNLLDLTSSKTIIENYILYDFNTNFTNRYSAETDGFLLTLDIRKNLFAFNSGLNILETYSNGIINDSPLPVWEASSGTYYEIQYSSYNYWDTNKLIKEINDTYPYDFEIRFNSEENYGVQFFTSNKIISVPFSLWNIGINTPNDPTDDVRMIPFIKEYEERNYWGISNISVGENNYYTPTPKSDQIFWMFPDTEAGGYEKFAEKCRARGIGNVYDLNSDTSPQGYYVDFKEDTSYAIGNMIFHNRNSGTLDSLNPISSGTIIQFLSTKSLDGKTETFTTPFVKNPQIDYNFELFQNYPNPFNPNTIIRYFIPEDGLVKISVYNILGQKVEELVNKNLKVGKYETEFNGSNLASGIYIYRIEANKFIQPKKMMLLK